MRSLLLALISVYQRYLSPYKGFRCAYRCHTGRASCSALGYRAVQRYGAWRGIALIRRRTQLCGVAHRRYGQAATLPAVPIGQRGDCDLPCDAACFDGCSLPSGRSLFSACDAISFCCDCSGCDWPSRTKSLPRKDKDVHLPPKVRSRVEPRGRGTSKDDGPS